MLRSLGSRSGLTTAWCQVTDKAPDKVANGDMAAHDSDGSEDEGDENAATAAATGAAKKKKKRKKPKKKKAPSGQSDPPRVLDIAAVPGRQLPQGRGGGST